MISACRDASESYAMYLRDMGVESPVVERTGKGQRKLSKMKLW